MVIIVKVILLQKVMIQEEVKLVKVQVFQRVVVVMHQQVKQLKVLVDIKLLHTLAELIIIKTFQLIKIM